MTEFQDKAGEQSSVSLDSFWFFLGGQDLEMQTIRELLSERGITNVSDLELDWGAKASLYGDAIRAKAAEGYTPVLVELEDDLDLNPESVRIVDHHGPRAGENAPTSLEQVYGLLGLDFEEASEEHQAVAANDRGHVAELRAQGFSADRIRSIREMEWAVKGVTEEEKDQAVSAIQDHLELSDGVVIVQCDHHDHSFLIADLLLEEFSDRWELGVVPTAAIEPEVLLIEGATEWNLYAPGDVIEACKNRFSMEGTWFGGALPTRGYWGAKKELAKVESEEVVATVRAALRRLTTDDGPLPTEDILLSAADDGDLLRKPGCFSQFILPIAFSPELTTEPMAKLYFQRLGFDEANIEDDLAERQRKDAELIYERRRYFTEETGNMLYQHAAWFELRGCSANTGTFSFLALSTNRQVTMQWCRPRLVLFNWNTARDLALMRRPSIDDVPNPRKHSSNPLLNGFLIMELHPISRLTVPELMEFNETFRHLQVPFKSILNPSEGYFKKELEKRYEHLLKRGFPWPGTAKAEGDDPDHHAESMLTWRKWLDLLEFPVLDDQDGKSRYLRLMPREWIEHADEVITHRSWAGPEHALKAAEPKVMVWSTAVMDESAQRSREKLLDAKEGNERRGSEPKSRPAMFRAPRATSSSTSPSANARVGRRQVNVRAGDWIAFLNVDPVQGGSSHKSLMNASGFEMDWAERDSITYQRWAHWGSLYGFTGHSGCAFLPALEEPPFWRQWRTLYRDQGLFLLYERATLFRLSRSISSITQERISAKAGSESEAQRADKAFEEDFGALRRHFVSFANLYQFPLLSTEQQSLEMYQAQRQALDIDPLYSEVQSQIDNAHAYASLDSQKKATDLTTVITVLGIPLLIAGLLASVLGMDMSVPYAALIDFVDRIGSETALTAVSEASGLVRAALWLLAVIVVLLPIRLFENRLLDFGTAANAHVRRALRLVMAMIGGGLLLVLSALFVQLSTNGIALIWLLIGLTVGAVVVGAALFLPRMISHSFLVFWDTASVLKAFKAFLRPSRPTRSLSGEILKIIRKRVQLPEKDSNRE